MKEILWIHGFCGRPYSNNFKEMEKYNPQYQWFSIEVDHHALASMEKINRYIAEHDVALVAGTSLGGFYALCAEFDGPKMVVNPATNPVCQLRQFLGHNTYKPGRLDGQTDFVFTNEMLAEFGLLKPRSTANSLCHYTAHDTVLGEDVKNDYIQLFEKRKKINEDLLPGHFLSVEYVRTVFTEDLQRLLIRIT